MEGNACYKFSTIRRYIAQTGAPAVRLTIDVGSSVGEITRLLKTFFPSARVYAFEADGERFEVARARTAELEGVRLYHRAVTSQHLYHDDLGREPRQTVEPLRILKSTPVVGPGWRGPAPIVVSADQPKELGTRRGYENHRDPVRGCTLDQVVRMVLRRNRASEVDILKMDCEGCEHSCLGTASESTLQNLRYIVGEYHGIQRFFRVMRERLFQTHKVSLIGDGRQGAFFAERRDGTSDGILLNRNAGMLQPRPWLGQEAIEWHIFNRKFVDPREYQWHSL